MNSWSDNKKWWMGLLRSLITFAILATVSFFIIEAFNNRRDDNRHKAKAKLQHLEEIAEDFETAALIYFDSAHNAFLWTLGDKLDPDITHKMISSNQMDKFISIDKERYYLAIARVELYFPQLKPEIDKLKADSVFMLIAYGMENKNNFDKHRDKAESHTKELISRINEVMESTWNSLIDEKEHPKPNIIPNQRVDPTVKTPVELGRVQGTAGHP